MDAKNLWGSFTETGDPLCYLLAKQLERRMHEHGKQKQSAARTGDAPRPLD